MWLVFLGFVLSSVRVLCEQERRGAVAQRARVAPYAGDRRRAFFDPQAEAPHKYVALSLARHSTLFSLFL